MKNPFVLPLLLATLIRVSGVPFGLPRLLFDMNERLVVEVAVGTFGSDWSPVDARYPMLFASLVRLAYMPYVAALRGEGLEMPAGLFAVLSAAPAPLFLIARVLSLVFGVATVWLTGLLGARLGGARCGVFAATVLALVPLHVEMSRVARVDGPLALWATLALFLVVRYEQERRFRDAVLAAIATGCAISTKYSGVLLLPCLAIIALRQPASGPPRLRASRIVRLALLMILPLFILLATTPYLVLRPSKDLAGAIGLARLASEPFSAATRPGHAVYPEALVGESFGAGLLLAAAIGFVRRFKPRGVGSLPVLAFFVLYGSVFFVSRTAYDRFLLPIIPLFAIYAARGILAVSGRFRRSAWAVALVALLPTLPFLVSSVVIAATSADTRLRAVELIEARVPAGSMIFTASGGPAAPPLRTEPWRTLGGYVWMNPGSKLSPDEILTGKAIEERLIASAGYPAYRVRAVKREGWIRAVGDERPAAIFVRSDTLDALPPELSADYAPPIAIRPNFFCGWRTNWILLRKDVGPQDAMAD